ncbi:hypothetical protein Pmani_026353 [Petrolisthes manimaculis]|uniref:Ionotropic glutamate receptor L-glutamate and glycine-binding domain-containing protein n=1 Tax=Petrolisthes manimaculis TaxID=1843537 RepID=A0AAE1P3R1_9EUCA|nr:hypothetical protein Pmani_026353 [Petrolisthes manimaculis]
MTTIRKSEVGNMACASLQQHHYLHHGRRKPLAVRLHQLAEQLEDAGVEVWRRCGYCELGEAGVEKLGIWNATKSGILGDSSSFRNHPENYNRHKFRLLEKELFPYISSERLNNEPGTLVRHRDAIGTRVIQAMSSSLNFTYEIREPMDGEWGVELERGNWTGIVKQLQREEADICLDLTVTPRRYTVIQFTGAYIDQSAVLLSSKPRPLPEYLSLIRPFECFLILVDLRRTSVRLGSSTSGPVDLRPGVGWIRTSMSGEGGVAESPGDDTRESMRESSVPGNVWLAVVVSAAVWGTTLWLFQKVWPLALGGKMFSLNLALFYSWGVMLEDPPTRPPNNLTGQVV